MIEYTLKRSKRKTIAIYVRDGAVEVRAPKTAPMRNINNFVIQKEKWILEKLEQLREQSSQRDSFSLNYGDYIMYRGHLYPIREVPAKKYQGFDNMSFNIVSNQSSEQIKAKCIEIYRTLARNYVSERMLHFAHYMSISSDRINLRINNAKSRWGSCSLRGINIAWRIIMADDDVIDYLVVHELAHMYEMNHGANFWNIVERMLPDYKIRRAKLRELQRKQDREDWG